MAIAVQQLASIGAPERRLFPALLGALEARWGQAKLWTPARDASVEPWILPAAWDLGRWPALWPGVDTDPSAELEAAMRGRLDLDAWWPRVQQLVNQGCPPGPGPERWARLCALFAVSRALVDDPALERFAVWNPMCPHGGVAAELARAAGRAVVTFERGFLPDTWMVDADGLMGHSSLAARSLEELVEATGDPLGPLIDHGRRVLARQDWGSFARYDQGATGSLPEPGGPRLLVLGSDDTTTGFWPPEHPDRCRTRPGFGSSLDLAQAVAAAHPAATVLFKPHPSMARAGCDPVAPRPGIPAVLPNADFRALIRWSQVTVTAGSTTGVCVRALGRPLVVAARELLTGKGVAHEALVADDLGDAVAAALAGRDVGEHDERFAALVGWLDRHYLYGADEGPALARAISEAELAPWR